MFVILFDIDIDFIRSRSRNHTYRIQNIASVQRGFTSSPLARNLSPTLNEDLQCAGLH